MKTSSTFEVMELAKLSSIKPLLVQSKLFTLFYRHLKEAVFGYVRRPDKLYSFAALTKIRQAFPGTRVYLVHVPQKEEVIKGKYLVDIRKDINLMGITYIPTLEICSWSIDMYFMLDNHPNMQGYNNISQCVSKVLFG